MRFEFIERWWQLWKSRFRSDRGILPLGRQLHAWKIANEALGERIEPAEFAAAERLLHQSPHPVVGSGPFCGIGLFYGFGGRPGGPSDPVLSGRIAWDYARQHRDKTWQCEALSFHGDHRLRMRPNAPLRPRGFYLAAVDLGVNQEVTSAASFRDRIEAPNTGLGPEGLQLVAITHPYLAELMNERELPFLVLADYDLGTAADSPDVSLQLFSSMGTLGLGSIALDRFYPSFAIGHIRLPAVAPHRYGRPTPENLNGAD